MLINRQACDFFHSIRGVEQGNSLSPFLFILTAEVFARLLNNLFSYPEFKGFDLPKWSEKINLLGYVDDIIIVANGDIFSLKLDMKTLQDYEKQSG